MWDVDVVHVGCMEGVDGCKWGVNAVHVRCKLGVGKAQSSRSLSGQL